jgi:tRNA threonylcarbamoyl adenosine modification protein YeaZ
MILYINTIQNSLVEIALKNKGRVVAIKKFKSDRTQAEKFLPAIEKLLKASKLKLKDLKSIEIENSGGSFTSLRIGVVTANALAYALGITISGRSGKSKSVRNGKRSFKVIEPVYDRDPDITEKKK